jgi:hypothetical protein
VSSEEYFTATDLDGLRRQAELLELENTFLKGRVRSLTHTLRETRESEAAAREQLKRIRAADALGKQR